MNYDFIFTVFAFALSISIVAIVAIVFGQKQAFTQYAETIKSLVTDTFGKFFDRVKKLK